jgi:hypothetical protein
LSAPGDTGVAFCGGGGVQSIRFPVPETSSSASWWKITSLSLEPMPSRSWFRSFHWGSSPRSRKSVFHSRIILSPRKAFTPSERTWIVATVLTPFGITTGSRFSAAISTALPAAWTSKQEREVPSPPISQRN